MCGFIKTAQDAPSWMWYHRKLSFLLGGLYRFTLFPSMYGIKLFTRSPTKLIITYCDRVSHVDKSARITKSMYKYPIKCQHCNDRAQLQFFIHNSKFLSIYRTVVIVSDFYWPKTIPASFGIAATTRHQELSLVESFGKYDCGTRSTSTLATSSLILFTPSLKRPPLAIAVYISSSWWLNQPVWKMCSWNWIIPPIFGVNIKKMIELPPPSHTVDGQNPAPPGMYETL